MEETTTGRGQEGTEETKQGASHPPGDNGRLHPLETPRQASPEANALLGRQQCQLASQPRKPGGKNYARKRCGKLERPASGMTVRAPSPMKTKRWRHPSQCASTRNRSQHRERVVAAAGQQAPAQQQSRSAQPVRNTEESGIGDAATTVAKETAAAPQTRTRGRKGRDRPTADSTVTRGSSRRPTTEGSTPTRQARLPPPTTDAAPTRCPRPTQPTPKMFSTGSGQRPKDSTSRIKCL